MICFKKANYLFENLHISNDMITFVTRVKKCIETTRSLRRRKIL